MVVGRMSWEFSGFNNIMLIVFKRHSWDFAVYIISINRHVGQVTIEFGDFGFGSFKIISGNIVII